MESAAALSLVSPTIMLKDLPEEVRAAAASGVSPCRWLKT
jgi:hypothetical protein